MKYYEAFKKKKILPYVTTWMNLEDIILSEKAGRWRTNTAWFYLHEVTKIVTLIETEKNDRYQGLGEGVMKGCYKVSVI